MTRGNIIALISYFLVVGATEFILGSAGFNNRPTKSVFQENVGDVYSYDAVNKV